MFDEDDYLAQAPEEPMPYQRTDKYTEMVEDRNRWRDLCRDIVTVLGNNPYMAYTCMDSWIKKMCDTDDEKRMTDLANDILNRLTKIKPHEWGDR